MNHQKVLQIIFALSMAISVGCIVTWFFELAFLLIPVSTAAFVFWYILTPKLPIFKLQIQSSQLAS